MPEAPSLSQVLTLLEERADPRTAEDWDRVGLVCGDPAQPVNRVLFTVDVTERVADEAATGGVDLIVAHHPLLLRGVSGIPATTARGRILTTLIQSGCAVLSMHTNADQALGGVNDALADALGISRDGRSPVRPLVADGGFRIEVHVPVSAIDAVTLAMTQAGAGTIGRYEGCAFWVEGTGRFRPTDGAQPTIGHVGEWETVTEAAVEMVVPGEVIPEVVAAMRSAHPYEEPAFNLTSLSGVPGSSGLGRVGTIEPTTLREFAQTVATALPGNPVGVRVAGDPDRVIRTVAVCGGAGDSLLPDVAALGVDVYVTSDLRHHPVLDFVADHDTALVDIPHASGESLWLAEWAGELQQSAEALGWSLVAAVTQQPIEPWTFHVTQPPEGHQ